jgi:hypothetical protein
VRDLGHRQAMKPPQNLLGFEFCYAGYVRTSGRIGGEYRFSLEGLVQG